ncbi:MAG: DNA methyltransferase [Pseudomonadota bacterium]
MGSLAVSIANQPCFDALIKAAHCGGRVKGLTHNYYAYPARFSPQFVKASIETFTKAGDLVLDPFLGGGTTAVEARANSRFFIGSDISELAVYIAQVKSNPLRRREVEHLVKRSNDFFTFVKGSKTPKGEFPDARNLESHEATELVRKIMLALEWTQELDNKRLQDFGRCAILRTAQIVINGQKELPGPDAFDSTLGRVFVSMLSSAEDYRRVVLLADKHCTQEMGRRTRLINTPAACLPELLKGKLRILPKLIITSPPYPGVHVLYHRWQLLGGKETSLPFYIANKQDGKGLSHYCMHARSNDNGDRYFSLIRETFEAMRKLVDDDATVVQLVAFSKPEFQLQRYLSVMEQSGFYSIQNSSGLDEHHSSWQRAVPSRKWYTHLNAANKVTGGREYLLIHKPIL